MNICPYDPSLAQQCLIQLGEVTLISAAIITILTLYILLMIALIFFPIHVVRILQ